MNYPMNAPMEDTANVMAQFGRGGDDTIGHLTTGDIVVPRDIALENPDILVRVKKAMAAHDADYRTHVVGSGFENINPETGQPEFFFKALKKFFRSKIGRIIAPIAGALTGGALLPAALGVSTAVGTGLGSAAGSLASGQKLGQAALSGLTAGVGSSLMAGTPGRWVDPNTGQAVTYNTLGSSLASSGGFGSRVAASLSNAGLDPFLDLGAGTLTAINAGRSVADQFGSMMDSGAEKMGYARGVLTQPESPFNARRPDEVAMPSSLEDFSGADDIQKSTAIATRGLEGGGASTGEKNYFLNLIQRRLVDQNNQLADYSQVNPIEEQYLQQGLGLSFDPNTKSLLESISKRRQAA